jgi:hypothetical protein
VIVDQVRFAKLRTAEQRRDTLDNCYRPGAGDVYHTNGS